MARNVMEIRVVITGAEIKEQVYDRKIEVPLPAVFDAAVGVDADLVAGKLKQEIAGRLREIADEIEAKK